MCMSLYVKPHKVAMLQCFSASVGNFFVHICTNLFSCIYFKYMYMFVILRYLTKYQLVHTYIHLLRVSGINM